MICALEQTAGKSGKNYKRRKTSITPQIILQHVLQARRSPPLLPYSLSLGCAQMTAAEWACQRTPLVQGIAGGTLAGMGAVGSRAWHHRAGLCSPSDRVWLSSTTREQTSPSPRRAGNRQTSRCPCHRPPAEMCCLPSAQVRVLSFPCCSCSPAEP